MYNNKAIRRVVRAGRRSTIGNRVTGYNLFEGSNPLLSAKNEKAVPQGMAFSFLFARDSNKEGAGFACGRKQSCGLFSPTRSRSIATRRHTAVCRKNPLLSAKNEKAVPQGMAFSFFICKGFEQGGSRLCLRKKTILRTVFADAVKEHRDAKAYGSMPKKSLAELTIVFYNTKTGRQFGCLPVLLFVSNIGGVENHLGFEKVAVD